MNVIICTGKAKMVKHIEDIVNKYISSEETSDVRIELATTNQYEVLDLFMERKIVAKGKEKLVSRPLKKRLLLLDVNFGDDVSHLNGLELAKEIRKYDCFTRIAFVTSIPLDMNVVVAAKIEPLGYVYQMATVDLEKVIFDFLKTAYERVNTSSVIRCVGLRTEGEIQYINLSDIFYLKANKREDQIEDESKEEDEKKNACLAILYTSNGEKRLTKGLKVYEEENIYLLRIGRTYLVNPFNVKKARRIQKNVKVTMNNGEEFIVSLNAYQKYEKAVDELYKSGWI